MGLLSTNRTDPYLQTSWNEGMNTILPPEEIPPTAAVDISNFEFDDVGNLRSRLSPSLLVDTNNADGLVSIFTARFSNGTTKILYVTSSSPSPDLYWMDTNGTNITLLTNNLTSTPQERMLWMMFNDRVILITGLANGNSPIYSVDSAGTVVNLTNVNSAPNSNCGVVWNNRLWVNSGLNSIKGSAINDQTDWTVDDDAGAILLSIGTDEDDRISALSVFRGNLIVYKYKSIHIVSAISAPATIPSNLRVDLYTSNLGCVQKHTIQNILDDQIFLSTIGVISLALAPLGETKGSILSRNIAELAQIDLTAFSTSNTVGTSCYSLNVQKKQQYWLAVPSGIGNGTNTVWVMDYADISKRDEEGLPLVRWCKFTGNIFGIAYATLGNTAETYLMVSASASDQVFSYDPINDTSFAGTHTRRLLTRAYGVTNKRSLWHRFSISLLKLTSNVAFSANYYFDNYLTAKAGGYDHSLTSTPANNHRNIWRSFRRNDSGRKSNLVQIEITANTTDQGIVIKSIGLEYTALNFRRSQVTWVSD